MSIPFEIPAQFLAGLNSGDLVRYGTILKDVTTGKIVGHVQETGLLQKALQSGLSLNPATGTAAGLIGVAQNTAVLSKLNAMQAMMGTIQTLQIASLASSVIGIGVTAATAAMILNRLKEIDRSLESIESSIAALPSKWRELDLRKRMINVSTAVDRLQEAEMRSDADNVVKNVEEKLNYAFDELHDGISSFVLEAKIDEQLLRGLLAALALCGSAQLKSLIWLDEKKAAEHRASQHCAKMLQLAFRMPRDIMADKLTGGPQLALEISQDCSEIRLRIASQPDLVRSLILHDINGRDFIDRIQNDETAPLLILPSTKRA